MCVCVLEGGKGGRKWSERSAGGGGRGGKGGINTHAQIVRTCLLAYFDDL